VIDELRPSLLEDFGLVAALQDHCEAIARRAKIAIQVHGSDTRSPLEPAVENMLFRVAQEAINNILKHAQASRIDVHVALKESALRLEIQDDGVGFDLEASTAPGKHRGWGLVTMRERVEAHGGRLWVDSQPGEGTRLVVEVLVA
jgi:signal transduction histidine kinase